MRLPSATDVRNGTNLRTYGFKPLRPSRTESKFEKFVGIQTIHSYSWVCIQSTIRKLYASLAQTLATKFQVKADYN